MNNVKPVFGTNDYAHPGSYSAWNMDLYHRVVMPVNTPISYEDFSTTDRPELRKKLLTTSLIAQIPFEPMIQLMIMNALLIPLGLEYLSTNLVSQGGHLAKIPH